MTRQGVQPLSKIRGDGVQAVSGTLTARAFWPAAASQRIAELSRGLTNALAADG